MSKLDTLITDLAFQIEQLEGGRAPYLSVDKERVYELDQMEQAAQPQGYELTTEQMITAAQIGEVYAEQVSRLSPEQLEAKLIEAQKQKDGLALYLLSKHSPVEHIRIRAETLGTDREAMGKIAKARSLAARVKQLEAMGPAQRRQLARSLGHTVTEAQEPAQSPAPTVQEAYRALQADPIYSF